MRAANSLQRKDTKIMANAELKNGDQAPAFSLNNAAGENVKLSDFKGKTVVLFFYPKDDTPG